MAGSPLASRIIANHKQETVRVEYQWEIEKFTVGEASKGNSTFETNPFSPPGCKELSFYLKLYQGSRGRMDPTNLDISLFSQSPIEIYCKTSSWLLTKSGDKWKPQEVDFAPISNKYNKTVFTEPKSNVIDEKISLLPKDILTFCCEITLEFKIFSEKVTALACPIETQDAKNMITNDLGKLLQSGKFADFEFTIGQRKFPVHKAILHSRSPYFEALFSHDFKEKTTNSVPIEDIDADLFAQLLNYIYTSDLPNFTDEAENTQMMIIADRYQLEQLKHFCEYELSANITVDNMFNLLMLADTYNASMLKTYTKEFISNNASSMDILNVLFEQQQFGSQQSAAMLNAMRDALKDK